MQSLNNGLGNRKLNNVAQPALVSPLISAKETTSAPSGGNNATAIQTDTAKPISQRLLQKATAAPGGLSAKSVLNNGPTTDSFTMSRPLFAGALNTATAEGGFFGVAADTGALAPVGNVPEEGVFIPGGGEESTLGPVNIGEYNGVKIDVDGFSPDELTTVVQLIDTMGNDPDGSILLNTLKQNGGLVKRDHSTNNVAYAGGDGISFGNGAFESKDYALEVFGHELTHYAVQFDPFRNYTKNEESVGSTLGRRIRFRANGGQPFTFTDEFGKETVFDGSQGAEIESYVAGVRGARNPNSTSYKDLPEDTSVFATLRNLGITFPFDPDEITPRIPPGFD